MEVIYTNKDVIYTSAPIDIGLNEIIQRVTRKEFRERFKYCKKFHNIVETNMIEPHPNVQILNEINGAYYIINYEIDNYGLWKRYNEWKQYKALHSDNCVTWEEYKAQFE
ncbi:MAG: hypothetical protein QW156_04790 [Candidatus Aenigmatarchaeota archaeon]